jgi:hypothetical protein
VFTGYLTSVGKYPVEKLPCPGTDQRVDTSAPAAGVLHTTEGSFESSLAVFRAHYAPHFLVGKDKSGKVRIVQLLPLGEMAAALEHPAGYPESNRVARAQIELVGYSKQESWYPEPDVADALASLIASLQVHAGIPLSRPFPDGMPREILASRSFSRRSAGKWGKVAGWYGHVEIPGNSHWDPGNLEWTKLLGAARATLTPTPRPVPVPVEEPAPNPEPKNDTPFTNPDRYAGLDPMWAWFKWKDDGADQDTRPAQVPVRVPAAWWVRYKLHLGQ